MANGDVWRVVDRGDVGVELGRHRIGVVEIVRLLMPGRDRAWSDRVEHHPIGGLVSEPSRYEGERGGRGAGWAPAGVAEGAGVRVLPAASVAGNSVPDDSLFTMVLQGGYTHD